MIHWLQVKQVRDGIADIPDGVHGPRKPTRVCTPTMPSSHSAFIPPSASRKALSSRLGFMSTYLTCLIPLMQYQHLLALTRLRVRRRNVPHSLQLGTGRIPAGATASIELSGPDARAMNNPGYYQHSAESKALTDVSHTCCLL